jgi:hypothetical protein
VQRQDLLRIVAEAYDGLGEQEGAKAMRDQIKAWDEGIATGGVAQAPDRPELPFGVTSVSSPEVGGLEEVRRQAAYGVIQELLQGQQPSSQSLTTLSDALKAEDAAKLALYRQELEATTQSGRRIEVDWEMIRWLLLKYRVARQGFGLSVVPEWEQQAMEVQTSLSKAYENLLFDYEDLMTALPSADLIGPGRYEARRFGLLAGRLGQYPSYPSEQLADKLSAAANDLMASGYVDGLYVAAEKDGDALRFVFRTAADYGLAEESP